MHDWQAKFFEYGHKPDYVRDMNYWDYLNLIESFTRIAERQSKGKFSAGKKDSIHQKMIDKAKEGKKDD